MKPAMTYDWPEWSKRIPEKYRCHKQYLFTCSGRPLMEVCFSCLEAVDTNGETSGKTER